METKVRQNSYFEFRFIIILCMSWFTARVFWSMRKKEEANIGTLKFLKFCFNEQFPFFTCDARVGKVIKSNWAICNFNLNRWLCWLSAISLMQNQQQPFCSVLNFVIVSFEGKTRKMKNRLNGNCFFIRFNKKRMTQLSYIFTMPTISVFNKM